MWLKKYVSNKKYILYQYNFEKPPKGWGMKIWSSDHFSDIC